MGKVVISPSLVKTSDRIDAAGNVIHPVTKQIIQPKEQDYVPPVAREPIPTQPIPAQPVATPVMAQIDPLSIQAQIEQVKENLKKLEELKKLKIQEMKETIKLLKKK